MVEFKKLSAIKVGEFPYIPFDGREMDCNYGAREYFIQCHKYNEAKEIISDSSLRIALRVHIGYRDSLPMVFLMADNLREFVKYLGVFSDTEWGYKTGEGSRFSAVLTKIPIKSDDEKDSESYAWIIVCGRKE